MGNSEMFFCAIGSDVFDGRQQLRIPPKHIFEDELRI